MQLSDYYNSELENLHQGMFGPIYVSDVWVESERESSMWMFDESLCPIVDKRRWKATIECQSPEILNLILGKLKDIETFSYDETPLTAETSNNIIDDASTMVYDSVVSEIQNKLMYELENDLKNYKYKRKHKILYKC